jgi:hypothetical protein
MQLPWNKNKNEVPDIKEMSAAEYEKLGRAIEQVYVHGYASRKRLILMSLYKGMGYGLGIFIGGTIIVALLAYGLSQFETIDILKPILEPIQQTIQEVNGGPVVPTQETSATNN